MSTRFATPAELHTRPRNVERQERPTPRKCACGRPISDLLGSDQCHHCDEAEAAASLAASIAKTKAQEAAQQRQTKRRCIEVDGVKLRPVDPESIPGRQSNSGWARVVDEFLAAGVDAAAVETKGDPHAHQTALSMAIRKAGKAKEVYATCRKGRTYLVRVKPIGGAS